MPKPLRSESVERPQDIQFKHFGVINPGAQSKSSVFTATVVMSVLLLLAVIVSASVKKVSDERRKEELTYATIPKVDPPKPPPPKIVPPKPPPPRIEPPKIEPPKIIRPDVKIPDPPKPVPVKMDKPMPVMKEAPPKMVVAAAAPRPTTVNLGQAASVPNADRNPSAVRLGQSNNPIVPSDRPAVASAVNLGRQGISGMPASNTGGGPRSASVNLGSGQPNGGVNGTGARAVAGVALGRPGSNGVGPGNATGNRPSTVSLGENRPPVNLGRPPVEQHAAGKNPTVLSKPRPVYTADATAAHVEGTIQVRIHVSSSGQVTVLSVSGSLGHGLDAEARRVAEGTRFRPATDAAGTPIDWEGTESVTFQLAG